MMLKKAFTEAKKSGIITENIMDSGYSRPPKSKKNREKIRGLTEAEQKKLLETLQAYKVPVHGNTYKLQLLIELYTGMRMGEINSLKPEDIDFESGLIHVKRTVSRGLNDRHYINDVPKTQAGIRSIPMNKMARALLEEAVEKMKPNKEGLIFYDYRKDDIVTTTQVCNYYRRVCERAGIKYYGQHSLRHTFATRCIEAGIEALVLKEWLGHTNIHITLDTYSDVFNRMHDDAMEKFEKYITTEELK